MPEELRVCSSFLSLENYRYLYILENKFDLLLSQIAREQAEKSGSQLVPPEAAPSSAMAVSAPPVETHPSSDVQTNGPSTVNLQPVEQTSSPVLVTPVVTINPPSTMASVPSESITSSSMVPMGTTTSGPSFTLSAAAASTMAAISSAVLDTVAADKYVQPYLPSIVDQ